MILSSIRAIAYAVVRDLSTLQLETDHATRGSAAFQNHQPGVAFFMIISRSDADSPNRRKRLHDRAGL
jgi:hypothetical protein